MTKPGIGILGTGSYLPGREVGNTEIAARFGVDEDWIERKTLIRTRRFAEDHEAVSDLAVPAARAALERAGIPAERISYLIVSTGTGDFPAPPTSYLVQNALGAFGASCFDLNATCAGFVYALAVARSLVATTPGAYALVVASEIYSRFTDPKDRATAVLLADGAGAAVVGPTDGPGILDVELRSYGDKNELIVIPAGGSRNPASAETVGRRDHAVRMQGRAVTEFVLDNVPGVLDKFLSRNGLEPGDVDHFVPHQANGAMVGRLAEVAGLTRATTHLTAPMYGNSGSASVPVTLDHAARSGRLKDGHLVLLTAFGSGMTLGACLLTWAGGAR
ncbi:3-oxoacyl-ACP synthase III family protein [Kitasatospora brasiliensis]|uniref:3-oxoacyl-ACP synthase III family protein n=1 Tax=Kitasatospora brasiliensis TaxID=3058040 RepID=UPI00292E9F27|nr:ketoacyl-ACP synthase III [Kitasatospora sp. K002]